MVDDDLDVKINSYVLDLDTTLRIDAYRFASWIVLRITRVKYDEERMGRSRIYKYSVDLDSITLSGFKRNILGFILRLLDVFRGDKEAIEALWDKVNRMKYGASYDEVIGPYSPHMFTLEEDREKEEG